MIERTSDVYVDAFQRITGRAFDAPPPGQDIVARVRGNLARYVS
jgi:phosphoribosylaminoimidazole-succinocarboxamide synthase